MVPRKNGKTYLAASIAIMMLVSGGQLQRDGRFSKEPGAEVYFVATKEDQAKIGWTDCAKIVKRSHWVFRNAQGPSEGDPVRGSGLVLQAARRRLRFSRQAQSVVRDQDEFHAWKDRALNG